MPWAIDHQFVVDKILVRKEDGVGEDLTRPSSQVSPWDVYQVCLLGFAQERIQELALVK